MINGQRITIRHYPQHLCLHIWGQSPKHRGRICSYLAIQKVPCECVYVAAVQPRIVMEKRMLSFQNFYLQQLAAAVVEYIY